MSDLRTALETLKREHAVKLREAAKIEELIKSMRDMIGMLDGPMEPTSTEFEGVSIAEAATRLINEGRPLTTREIADQLLQRGVKTTSKNFTMTVYTVLRESKKFRRTNSSTWELVPAQGRRPSVRPSTEPSADSGACTE